MVPQEGPVADAILAFFYNLLRLLPTEWASAIGSHGIRWNARTNRPDIIEGAKRNLRRHKPHASEADLDAMVDEFLDGVGRVAAEFAVMHRFLPEGRIEIVGMEPLKAAAGTRPILALCVHAGNWEVFSPAFQAEGIRLSSIIEPPKSAFERRIVDLTRKRFGVNTIIPDFGGIRSALRILGANQTVSMFPDEAREGLSMGPLFGRPPHARGNLAIAAKLARRSNATFVLGHCRRVEPCRFRLTFSELFTLPETNGEPDLLSDVAFLNDRIEPIVLENIPRWYFLDDRVEPVES